MYFRYLAALKPFLWLYLGLLFAFGVAIEIAALHKILNNPEVGWTYLAGAILHVNTLGYIFYFSFVFLILALVLLLSIRKRKPRE